MYFAPEAEDQFVAAGLRPGRMGYFASRSAPMGRVTAAVTTATFVNFNPDLVARFIPRAWTLATTEDVLAARFRGAESALRRLLGEAADSDEVVELGELCREATSALVPEARPLYAAHAALEWPDRPLLVLWHAVTLLREFRGDGHALALVDAGLCGIESIVTHCATGRGFTVAAAKQLRGWSDEQWDAALAGLAERGLMDGAQLTAEGAAVRQAVESHTDALDVAAWRHLGEEKTARVIELGKQLSKLVVGNGAFAQPGVFA